MLYPAITIRQPWAALIVNGIKDVENRNWRLPDKYRNCTVLVHASAKPVFNDHAARRELFNRDLTFADFAPQTTLSGHIVGAVRFKGCKYRSLTGVADLPSVWAEEESICWWMVGKAVPIPPVPAKGKLSF